MAPAPVEEEESDQMVHESLANNLRRGDFRSIQETLESSTFLPYNEEIVTQAMADLETEGQQEWLLTQASSPNIDGRRKTLCIIESIQLLLRLIMDPLLLILLPADAAGAPAGAGADEEPLDLIITNFFAKIDLQYCVPTLRDNYDESTLYYNCLIHELCIERKYDTLRIIFNMLPLHVLRKELQRHDYLSIEESRGAAAAQAEQQQGDDPMLENQGDEDGEDAGAGLLLHHHQQDDDEFSDEDSWGVGMERFCTPLQAAWEKMLIDHSPQFIIHRFDSITNLSDLYLDENQDIKDLLKTSVLLLRAYDEYDGRSSTHHHHSCYPPLSRTGDHDYSSTTTSTSSNGTSIVVGSEEDDEQQDEESSTLFFDRITHVLIRLGHCGHVALFRFIVLLYPQSLDIRDDDGNLPIHLLSSSTIFNFSRRPPRTSITRRRRSDGHQNHHHQEMEEEEPRQGIGGGDGDHSILGVELLVLQHQQHKNAHHQHDWDMPPILILLELYPQYAAIPDKNQNLPLHLFLLSFRENYNRKETLRNLFRNNMRSEDDDNDNDTTIVLFLEEQEWNQNDSPVIDICHRSLQRHR